MRYRTILFDLDGTLTDSSEGVMGSAAYAFEKLGLPVPATRELRTVIGPPLRVSFPALGIPQEQVEEAVRLYREKYIQHGGLYQNTVYPGIEDLLRRLKERGCRLFVATSKPETLARELLRADGLDGYFEDIAGASFDHSRDSKGEVLAYLLASLGKEEPVVLIGDTVYDTDGAREQHIPCIGVGWGFGSAGELLAGGAEAVADSPEALYEYLIG